MPRALRSTCSGRSRRSRSARSEAPHPDSLPALTPVPSAAIDIGSNTTRLLVAEVDGGELTEVMQQRAYTRIGAGAKRNGKINAEKIAEVCEVVQTQVKLANEMGAEEIRIVATAAIRESKNCKKVVNTISDAVGLPVEVLSDEDEGRLAFLGASRSLSHPGDGKLAVVDIGGGSSEVIFGSVSGGVEKVQSFKIGSGSLADEHLTGDPPSAAEIRALRDHIQDFFEGVELDKPEQAVAVGGSATSLRTLVGAVLEYETLERAVRVLTDGEMLEVARRFELDSRRVRILPAGVLLLEKFSEMLGMPMQIGRGGLREGVILDMIRARDGNGKASGRLAA